jgi:hypothetical protein
VGGYEKNDAESIKCPLLPFTYSLRRATGSAKMFATVASPGNVVDLVCAVEGLLREDLVLVTPATGLITADFGLVFDVDGRDGEFIILLAAVIGLINVLIVLSFGLACDCEELAYE